MEEKKSYLFIFIGIIFLFAIFAFYATCSFSNSFEELRKISNYFEMWIYTFFVEGKLFLILCPIIIIYMGANKFHKIYHSGYIKNILQRKRYSKFLKNEILKAWLKGSYFYVLFSFIIILLCYFCFKNESFSLVYLPPLGNVHPIYLLFLSSFFSIVLSVVVVNVSLIVTKYSSKFSLTMIVSYLVFLAYVVFSEIILGNFFQIVLKGEKIANSFSLFNMIIFDGNFLVIACYSAFLLLLSTFLVIKIYANKSEVLLSGDEKRE